MKLSTQKEKQVKARAQELFLTALPSGKHKYTFYEIAQMLTEENKPHFSFMATDVQRWAKEVTADSGGMSWEQCYTHAVALGGTPPKPGKKTKPRLTGELTEQKLTLAKKEEYDAVQATAKATNRILAVTMVAVSNDVGNLVNTHAKEGIPLKTKALLQEIPISVLKLVAKVQKDSLLMLRFMRDESSGAGGISQAAAMRKLKDHFESFPELEEDLAKMLEDD